MTAALPEQGPSSCARRWLSRADQDPLIGVYTGADGLPTVSLYGRVQQEVPSRRDTYEEYGIEVEFAATRARLHVERPRGVADAFFGLNTDANPYHATIGLRVAPGGSAPG